VFFSFKYTALLVVDNNQHHTHTHTHTLLGPEDEEVYLASEAEWRIRTTYEKEIEAADLALQAQMDDEMASVAKLKAEISRLLDQLQVFDTVYCSSV